MIVVGRNVAIVTVACVTRAVSVLMPPPAPHAGIMALVIGGSAVAGGKSSNVFVAQDHLGSTQLAERIDDSALDPLTQSCQWLGMRLKRRVH